MMLDLNINCLIFLNNIFKHEYFRIHIFPFKESSVNEIIEDEINFRKSKTKLFSQIFFRNARVKCEKDCICRSFEQLEGIISLYLPLINIKSLNNSNEWEYMNSGILFTTKILINPNVNENLVNIHVIPFEYKFIDSTSIDDMLSNREQPILSKIGECNALDAQFYKFISFLCAHNSNTLHEHYQTELIMQYWYKADYCSSMELFKLRNCNLYNNKRIQKMLPEAVIIPVPKDCLNWIISDSVILQLDNTEKSTTKKNRSLSTLSSSSSSSSFSSCDNDNDAIQLDPSLKENIKLFTDDIRKAINFLGGYVFPELNWSSPKDAAWITSSCSMKLSNPRDVILLLKASERLAKDLEIKSYRPYDSIRVDNNIYPEDKYLTLKKWIYIDNELEFRAFFGNDQIIGISQKNPTVSNKIYNDTYIADRIRTSIQDFFNNILKNILNELLTPIGVFTDEYQKKIFNRGAFDVYFFNDIFISERPTCNLLSVSPWGELTDSFLFNYTELRELAWETFPQSPDDVQECIPLRLYDDSIAHSNVIQNHCFFYPKDLIDNISLTNNASKIVDFIKDQDKLNSTQSS